MRRDIRISQSRYLTTSISSGSRSNAVRLVEMIERNYGRFIRDDGDAPLRVLLEGQTETLGETIKGSDG